MGPTAASRLPWPILGNRDGATIAATRIVVSTFGVLAGLAAVEHGAGEMLQGWARPEGLVIESWPDHRAFEILGGEPALTVIPNLLITGVAAVVVAIAVAVWSAGFVGRRHGGLVLILLSVLLLLVGGGFGPPLIGIIAGVGAARAGVPARRRPGHATWIIGRFWPWAWEAAVLGYLSLLPGTIILGWFLGGENASLVASLSLFSFAALIVALGTALAEDRVRAG